MIIYFIFSVVNSTLIEQSFSIKQEKQALLYLSAIKQFSSNYNFGVLHIDFRISAAQIYQLIYIPDSSSDEYYCFIILKKDYHYCFNHAIIEDKQHVCQEIVIDYIYQNLIENNTNVPILICSQFQNLTIIDHKMSVQIKQVQTLVTPVIVIRNIYIGERDGISIDVKMNLKFENDNSDYEASIILGIMFISIILILSFILCLSCNRYKEIKTQLKYQDNVYKKIKQKNT